MSSNWIDDQRHFEETGEQPDWRSENPLVPAAYRLDLEFVCFTNAENLAALAPHLSYVEGLARLLDDESSNAWGEHAWCQTEAGEVVDPYFEWKFPGQGIEYRALEIYAD
jgi:hypothetical protein